MFYGRSRSLVQLNRGSLPNQRRAGIWKNTETAPAEIADPYEGIYAVPWSEGGDLEINVIGGMLHLVGENESRLGRAALKRIRDYIASRIDQAIAEATN